MVRPAESDLGSTARLKLSCPVKKDVESVVHVG
jgi:hypothetical protein